MPRGKIVLVPFPFDDLSNAKVRPALCLTDPVGPHRHLVLAFITSRVPVDMLDSDLVLDAHTPGFPQTGLRVTSTIRLSRLVTLAETVIQRELGDLPVATQCEIDLKLRKLFKL